MSEEGIVTVTDNGLAAIRASDIPVRMIIFNGPPGCGKDYAVSAFDRDPTVLVRRLSAPLKQIIKEAANVSAEQIINEKDKIIVKDKTLRQHQIDLFLWLAERFGEKVLGTMLANHIKEFLMEDISIIQALPLYMSPDGGRPEEVTALVEAFGEKNILIIRIHRDGYDFEGDIRQYLDIPNVETIDVENDGSRNFRPMVARILNDWLQRWVEGNKELLSKMGAVSMAPTRIIK